MLRPTDETLDITRRNVLAVRGGFDTAFVGLKYGRWLGSTPFTIGLGVGTDGGVNITPYVQVVPLQIKGLSLYTQFSALYSPFDGLLIGEDTILLGGFVGLQLWPSQLRSVSLYLNVGLGVMYVLKGAAEGGLGEGYTEPSSNIQIGIAF